MFNTKRKALVDSCIQRISIQRNIQKSQFDLLPHPPVFPCSPSPVQTRVNSKNCTIQNDLMIFIPGVLDAPPRTRVVVLHYSTEDTSRMVRRTRIHLLPAS